jgi:hypothetical protein
MVGTRYPYPLEFLFYILASWGAGNTAEWECGGLTGFDAALLLTSGAAAARRNQLGGVKPPIGPPQVWESGVKPYFMASKTLCLSNDNALLDKRNASYNCCFCGEALLT